VTDEAKSPDQLQPQSEAPPSDVVAPSDAAASSVAEHAPEAAKPPEPPKPPDYDAEIAEIVAELMDERVKAKEREKSEAAARLARRLRRGLPLPAQIVIITLGAALIAWPPAAFLPRRHATTYTMMQGARVQTWLIANDIERFRRANGRLPLSLEEINRADHGVAYERAEDGSRYTLNSQSPAFRWQSDQAMTRILSGVPNSLVPVREGSQ
jgi:hypothetical protein